MFEGVLKAIYIQAMKTPQKFNGALKEIIYGNSEGRKTFCKILHIDEFRFILKSVRNGFKQSDWLRDLSGTLI